MRRPTALKCLLGLTASLSAYTIISSANLSIRCIAYTYTTCCHHLILRGSAQTAGSLGFFSDEQPTYRPDEYTISGFQMLDWSQSIPPCLHKFIHTLYCRQVYLLPLQCTRIGTGAGSLTDISPTDKNEKNGSQTYACVITKHFPCLHIYQ